jgi:sterol desaturase/sphingolipid hydroxylase (fatty acid hydroxylase superfamily)
MQTSYDLAALSLDAGGGVLYKISQIVVWLVLLTVIFVPLEKLFSVQSSKIFRKQFGVDLIWYAINSVLPALIIAVPIAVLTQIFGKIVPQGYYTAVEALPFWLKLVLALFLSDIGSYWGHRAAHTFPWLWRFHEVHHSAEHMDWLVNTRAHPLDVAFTRLCGYALVLLFGLTNLSKDGDQASILPLITVFGIFWTFFIHSNIRWRFGFLEWVISTPAFHHWHHTKDEARDKNFAALFPVVDLIFKTSWLPKRWPTAYGVSRAFTSNFLTQFLDPILKIFRS